MVEIFINENPFVELSAQPTTDFNGSFPWIGKWPLDRTVRLGHPNSRWSPARKATKKSTGFWESWWLVGGSPKNGAEQKIWGVS